MVSSASIAFDDTERGSRVLRTHTVMRERERYVRGAVVDSSAHNYWIRDVEAPDSQVRGLGSLANPLFSRSVSPTMCIPWYMGNERA